MKKETIMKLLGPALETKSESKERESLDCGIKIVVLQRGWVVIGNLTKEDEYYTLTNAYVIRKWGTSAGLGELALKGKQSDTVIDKTGTVRFHELTTVALIDCDKNVWEKEL